MEYKKFKEMLAIANLSVKQFSEKANVSYSTCNNWTTSVTPSWVESWLELYIENQRLNKLKEIALEVSKNSRTTP